MIHKIVAVYDTKAEAYMRPVFVQSFGAAERSFGDAVNDTSTEYSKHPEDYIMFSLGEYNDADAVFYLYDKPVELARALNLLEA